MKKSMLKICNIEMQGIYSVKYLYTGLCKIIIVYYFVETLLLLCIIFSRTAYVTVPSSFSHIHTIYNNTCYNLYMRHSIIDDI